MLAAAPRARPKIEVAGLNFYYGARRVLDRIAVEMPAKEVTALIGPSGCGKSTFLRTLRGEASA